MEFLLASVISCSDGQWILDGFASNHHTSIGHSQMISEVLRDMPDDCQPSDYKGEES